MKGFEQLVLDHRGKRSLQSQLTEKLKHMIREGRLRPSTKLPSTRTLAEELGISRNTVVAAYEQLQGEGYLQARERSAFVVGAVTRAFGSGGRNLPVLSPAVQRPRLLGPPRPFRPSQPDVNLFSFKMWNRHRTRALRRGSSLLHYQSRFSMGLDELRQNVATYLRDSRGIRCHWEDIAITGGSQQALFMIGHLLLAPGRTAYMEDPGFPGARRSWEQAHASVIPVPLDEEGIRLPLPEAPDPTLVFVTPSNQFPLGTCMSLGRRLALLQFANQHGLWIVEDDYDSEFHYNSVPQPSLQSLDERRRVIYVGSFSKMLFPGMRLGYVVLPPELVEPFIRLKAAMEDHGPLLDQATLAGFLESGALDSHLRRCRRIYRQRQQLFLDLVRQKGLPLDFPVIGRGMNLAGHFTKPLNDRELSAALATRGVDIPALSSYGTDVSMSGLLFGFTAFTDNQIRAGIEEVSSAFA